MDGPQNWEVIGREILSAARNRLCLHLHHLDAALCALEFASEEGVTLSLATDGEALFYSGTYLADRYLLPRAGEPGVLPRRPALYAAAPVEEAGEGAGPVGPGL